MQPTVDEIKEAIVSRDPDVQEPVVCRLAPSCQDGPINVDSDQDDFEDDEVIGRDDGVSKDLEPDEQPRATVRREKRIGHNEPCPCGSGKKFKECCYRP